MASRRRTGFTLIELLIVVVIIGILAAIAIPKFGATRGKANEASLKGELRNLLTAQEQYYGDNNAYATTTSLAAANLWVVPDGVTSGFGEATNSFSATLTKGGKQCAVTYFLSGEESSAATNGIIECGDAVAAAPPA